MERNAVTTDNGSDYSTVEPDEELRRLDRLVGTWEVSGGAQGRVTYEWMGGGFFLLQHVELEQFGEEVTGIEVIGRIKPFDATEHSADIVSRFYDSQGNTFDYVYEVEGDVLTIWGGERGSPAYYRGEFRDDGNGLDGAWVYPGGGGYESSMRRLG